MAVNVTTDPLQRVDITHHGQSMVVRFSYSVLWVPSTTKFEDRMLRYTHSQFLPSTLEIHWLSIINILVLVLLLTAFLAVILMRVVKNDFTRYSFCRCHCAHHKFYTAPLTTIWYTTSPTPAAT